MGESRRELVTRGAQTVRCSTHHFENHTLKACQTVVTWLSMSPPPGARRADSSCIGGLSGRDTTDIWWACLRLVIVISYNLYAEAWGALRGIER